MYQSAQRLRDLMRLARNSRDPEERAYAFAEATRISEQIAATPPPVGPEPPRTQTPMGMVGATQQHPPLTGSFVQPQIAPSRILTVSGIPIAAPGGVATAPAKLDFSASGGCEDGLLIGMFGSVADFTAGVEAAGNFEYAAIELQATFNDNENIVTDGEAASFVRYSDLFSPGSDRSFLIMRRVKATDVMNFRWRNTQPAATGRAIQPSLSFSFRRGYTVNDYGLAVPIR